MVRLRKVAAASREKVLQASNTFITKLERALPQLKDRSTSPQTRLNPRTRIPRNVAVKDNIVSAETRTTCASAMLQDYRSPFTAQVVSSLQYAGDNVVGKANMDEFGMGSHSTNSFFGPVNNTCPWDLYSVGGSSGGSAMAVASSECRVSLGTDTGGSVRLPAAYTGVLGFKPSYGIVSRWGVIPYANSLDTVGFFAQEVSLISSTFDIVSNSDSRDPTSISTKCRQRIQGARNKALFEEEQRLKRSGKWTIPNAARATPNPKIGVPLEYNIAELDPGVRQAWQNALEILQNNGAIIVPISLPNTKHALSAYYVLAPAEAASNLAKYDGVRYGTRSPASDGAGHVLYSNTRGAGFGDEVKRRILLGSYTLSSEAVDNYFIKAQKVRRLVQRDFDRVFAIPNPLREPEQFDLSDMDDTIQLDDKLGPPQVDFIVCPTAPTPPPTLDAVSKATTVDTYMNDVFTVPASLAGLPAISVPFPIPAEHVKSDKPDFAGIQIIGQFFDDRRVLAFAEAFEVMRENFAPKSRSQSSSDSSSTEAWGRPQQRENIEDFDQDIRTPNST